MSAKAIAAQQMGPAMQGNPGQKPSPCATGITSAARAELGKYENPQVASRINDVIDRKAGRGQAVINAWPPA
jgi:hypothetical protein